MTLEDFVAARRERWRELETMLQDLLQRDRDHLWPKELGVAKTPIGKADADVAIAFATMVDGLARGEVTKSTLEPRLRPGTVLMREHGGVRHTVTVVPPASRISPMSVSCELLSGVTAFRCGASF